MDIISVIDTLLDEPSTSEKKIPVEDSIDAVTIYSLLRYYNEKSNRPMKKNTNKCLNEEEVALFIEQKSDYSGYDKIIEHLSTCSGCRTLVDDVKSALTVEELPVPFGIDKKIFNSVKENASTTSKGSFSSIKRFIIPLAAAASLCIVITITFFALKPTATYNNIVNFNVPVKSDIVLQISMDDVTLYGQLSHDSSTGIKAFTHHINTLKINRKIVRRTLMKSGYLYFLLKHSESSVDELTSALTDAMAISMDPIKVREKIKSRDYSSFEEEINRLDSEEQKAFTGGYSIGFLIYSDITNTVDADLLKSTRTLLEGMDFEEIEKYITALEKGEIPNMSEMRQQIRESIISY